LLPSQYARLQLIYLVSLLIGKTFWAHSLDEKIMERLAMIFLVMMGCIHWIKGDTRGREIYKQ